MDLGVAALAGRALPAEHPDLSEAGDDVVREVPVPRERLAAAVHPATTVPARHERVSLRAPQAVAPLAREEPQALVGPVVAGDAIKRDLAGGHKPIIAAWLGPTKLATAIVFATITNIVAYLPFLLLSGDTGHFLFTLPVVLTCSLVASRLVSMTFIPLLGYYLLRPGKKPELPMAERRTKGFAGWLMPRNRETPSGAKETDFDVAVSGGPVHASVADTLSTEVY